MSWSQQVTIEPDAQGPAARDRTGVRSTSTETLSPTNPPPCASCARLIPRPAPIKSSLQAQVTQFRQGLHQTAIMKFVALALALFAVGCQAAPMQADAPSELDHARGVMRVYLEQIKNSAINVANRLDDEETKNAIISRVNDLHTQILALQDQVKPITDNAVSTIAEATQDLRTSIHNDFETLQKELEPMRSELRVVVDKHIQEYKDLLTPIMEEYKVRHEAEMAALKTKLEPVMDELRAKIAVNVEETKSKLVPIVDTIRDKLTERIETVKQMVDPYVQEYKEHLKTATDHLSQLKATNLEDVKTKLTPHVDSLKTSLDSIINELKAAVGQ